MKNRFLLLICLLPLLCHAQEKKQISYAEYMKQVMEKNISYASEKLNIPMADAAIRQAKVFNDPSLSVEYANNDDHRMQMGQGVTAELSKTFSMGKRGAKIDMARSEKAMTQSVLDNFFSTLRAQATIAYLEAIRQERLYDVKLNSYNSINDLAIADSIKFGLGKITQTDAMQSRLEAGVIYNELLQAQCDLQNAYRALYSPMGQFNAQTLWVPTGELKVPYRDFAIGELLEMALENRSDLAAALKNVDVAKKALKLTRREQNLDLDVTLGYNHNMEVRNELAPAPKFNGITLGVAIPLKFSSFNRASINAASLKASQAEANYRQAQLEVQTEVTQNYYSYMSLRTQVERFNDGMMTQAKSVLDGKIYSYNRGETSLLEVLNAQRTYNEVMALYIETLFNHYVSLVNLEHSVGIWDINVQ